MKNANVHAEAARWAHGDYSENTAAYFLDIDHDGGDELVMHNDQVLITDLGSKFGTTINGVDLTHNQPTPAEHGAKITIAKVLDLELQTIRNSDQLHNVPISCSLIHASH